MLLCVALPWASRMTRLPLPNLKKKKSILRMFSFFKFSPVFKEKQWYLCVLSASTQATRRQRKERNST